MCIVDINVRWYLCFGAPTERKPKRILISIFNTQVARVWSLAIFTTLLSFLSQIYTIVCVCVAVHVSVKSLEVDGDNKRLCVYLAQKECCELVNRFCVVTVAEL